jgi:hypothetical protein
MAELNIAASMIPINPFGSRVRLAAAKAASWGLEKRGIIAARSG